MDLTNRICGYFIQCLETITSPTRHRCGIQRKFFETIKSMEELWNGCELTICGQSNLFSVFSVSTSIKCLPHQCNCEHLLSFLVGKCITCTTLQLPLIMMIMMIKRTSWEWIDWNQIQLYRNATAIMGFEVAHDNVVSSDKWRWSILVFSFSFYFDCIWNLSWNENNSWSENQSKTSDCKCFRTIEMREKCCDKN